MKKHLFPLFIAFIAAMGFSSCEESEEMHGTFSDYDKAKLIQEFSAEASTTGSFAFNLDCAWTAVVESEKPTKTEWLTLDKTSGEKGESTIIFTLLANETGADRATRVIITCDTGSALNVNIKQKAVVELEEPAESKAFYYYDEKELEQLFFYEKGIANTFTFTASSDWTVATEADWLTFKSGENDDDNVIEGGVAGESQFSFLVTRNDAKGDRDAVVILKSGSEELVFNIKQKEDPNILLTFTDYDKELLEKTFLYTAQNNIFTFYARADWTVSSTDETWATVDVEAGGKGEGEIVIELKQNTADIPRKAEVVIQSGEDKITIKITQRNLGAFELFLIEKYDADRDGIVDEVEAVDVNSIDCTDKGFTDLIGLEIFVNLEQLLCSGNNLTFLDVSMLSKLKVLNCYDNNIVHLDVSRNPLITNIDCAPMQSLETLTVDGANVLIEGITNSGPTRDVNLIPKDTKLIKVAVEKN